jgi:glycosyltransferase involved in cell wall biosynthesis
VSRRLLIVIPCLNEWRSLPALAAELRALAKARPEPTELLVIDDGSSDGTAAAASALGLRAVRLCSNLGIGGAVQTGLRVALAEGFDCAAQLDGDGQHPAEELPALLARLDGPDAPDLVVGSRFLRRSGFQSTPARRVGIRWLSLVLRLFAGVRSTDPTSGFRVYGPRALRLFDWKYPYDYPEPETLALASRAGLTIVEEPVSMRARSAGQSSIRGLGAGYYMLKVTLAILLDLVRNARAPLQPLPVLPAPSLPAALSPEKPWSTPSAATGSSPSSAPSSRP